MNVVICHLAAPCFCPSEFEEADVLVLIQTCGRSRSFQKRTRRRSPFPGPTLTILFCSYWMSVALPQSLHDNNNQENEIASKMLLSWKGWTPPWLRGSTVLW